MSWPNVPCPPVSVDAALQDIIQRAGASADPQAAVAAAEATRVRGLAAPASPSPEAHVALAWAASVSSPPDWVTSVGELSGVH